MFNIQPCLVCPESIIESCGLYPLSLNDQTYIQEVVSTLSQPISDYSFANNFIWINQFNKAYRKTIHKHCCLFIVEEEGMHLFAPPLPEIDASIEDLKNALLQCFQIMNDYNSHYNTSVGSIRYISEEMLDRINQCNLEGLIVSPSSMGKDYVYEMEKMISLSGAGLASKRNARNKFIRENPNFRTEPMSHIHIAACMQLLDSWYQHKNQSERIYDQTSYDLTHARLACEMAISHWQIFNFKGMVLFVEDQLIGFTFGEALSATQASIIIEKTDHDFNGAPAFIFSEFCRQYWSEYAECNVGDEGGSPSLRFTKEQYRPIRYLNKYSIQQSKPFVNTI